MLLVDPELAAPRARPPVDATAPVAGLPLSDVGELDSVAARARDLIADEDLRLERREHRAQRLDRRIDPQRLPHPYLGLPGVEAEAVASADEHRPECEIGRAHV